MSKTQTQSDVYVLKQSNVIERISDSQKILFNKLWIYPAKGIAAGGLLRDNGAKIYIGEHGEGADCTPDPLDVSDLPMKIELPQGESKLLRDVIIQGAAGDGVYFKFWPA